MSAHRWWLAPLEKPGKLGYYVRGADKALYGPVTSHAYANFVALMASPRWDLEARGTVDKAEFNKLSLMVELYDDADELQSMKDDRQKFKALTRIDIPRSEEAVLNQMQWVNSEIAPLRHVFGFVDGEKPFPNAGSK